MPDDEDRPRDAAGAAGPSWSSDVPAEDAPWEALEAADLVVPDDARDLAADVAAYHREQRALRRRQTRARWLARRGTVPGLVTLSGLALAALVVALLTVMGPRVTESPPMPLPLANPTAAAGQVHGLLPQVSLTDGQDHAVSSLALRPAVLALLPLHCDCVALLDDLAGTAAGEGYGLDVVAPVAKAYDAEAAALPGRIHSGKVQVLYDASGELSTALSGSGVTVVLLDRDGTIFDVADNVAPNDRRLSALLQEMHSAPRLTG